MWVIMIMVNWVMVIWWIVGGWLRNWWRNYLLLIWDWIRLFCKLGWDGNICVYWWLVVEFIVGDLIGMESLVLVM